MSLLVYLATSHCASEMLLLNSFVTFFGHILTFLGRPKEYVGGLIFYHGFFLSSFFFRRLISELTERNSTIFGHMVRSKCNLKTHVQYLGHSLPLQIGGSKTTFLTTNSTATLTAYIFRMKHGIHKRASALQNTRAVLHRLKIS